MDVFQGILIVGLSFLQMTCSLESHQKPIIEDISNKKEIFFKDRRACQSMVFEDGDALFISNRNSSLSCSIYDLASKERITDLFLPYGEYSNPHGNTSCFGKEYYSAKSRYPVLYVSAWDGQRQAFVYDITKNGSDYSAALIQIIDPTLINEEIIGRGYLDWVIDSENGFIYSIAYGLKDTWAQSTGNYTHIVKFKLPDLKGNSIVYLKDEDVLDFFQLPVILAFQDKFYYNGHIYIAAGVPQKNNRYPLRLYDVNIAERLLRWMDLPFDEEPEGLCLYDAVIWLSTDNHNTIYNLSLIMDIIE